MFPVKHISVTIDNTPEEIYKFTSEVDNLPKWAAGVTTDMQIRFTEKNNLGVLDHVVTLADGSEFYNPMRVIRNGNGSELVFTLYRYPNTTDGDFERDAQRIAADFNALKEILERS